MNILPKLSNREKIILYFLTILILLNLVTVVYTHNLKSVSEDFRSMLDDRLVPSYDISQIQESFYKNRLHLEALIFQAEGNDDTLHDRLLENNAYIDSVISKFSKTKLTEKEAFDLEALRKKMAGYRLLESEIETLYRRGNVEEAQALFRNKGLSSFQALNEELHDLSDLQVEVGSELYRHTRDNISTINLVSYFSMGVAIVLAISMFKVLGIKFQ